LAAHREKDREYVRVMLDAGIVDARALAAGIDGAPISAELRAACEGWLRGRRAGPS
jgi:hypothetical protein